MEDSKIVQMFWDRMPEAITVTSEKYGSYCKFIAKNILGSNEDAEECVNDTYLNAWNAIPPHRPNILATFLGKITRNLSINKYKYSHAYKRGGSQIALVLNELEDCVSDRYNVEQEIDRLELVKAINTFLGNLPIVKRNIFIYRYWYATGISDIAKLFGMTEGSISMTLNRLRKKLRKYLLERGFEL